MKALALGADATMGGRVHFYGLGAAGEAGVDAGLGFLCDEVRRSLALNGLRSFEEVGPHVVARPSTPGPHLVARPGPDGSN